MSLEFGITLSPTLIVSQQDRSKTRLNTRFQTEVNLNTGLNRNFVFTLSLDLKQLKYNVRFMSTMY